MNKSLIFLIIAGVVLTFSIITICSAPIINKNLSSDWAYGNCQYYADKEEIEESLDEKYKNKKEKTLCRSRKAMYSLEYASLIFDILSGFFCTFLSFLQYLNIGKNFKKNTGLIGLITGIIGFILTFIYFVYSAYIFTNDTINIPKLFPNGAIQKKTESGYITAYSGESDDDSEYIKYKDLGQKQYNYDSDYYKIYNKEKEIASAAGGSGCIHRFPLNSNCEYIYYQPIPYFIFKHLYDTWTTTLVFSFLISICNIGLIIFGLLLFKEGDYENK